MTRSQASSVLIDYTPVDRNGGVVTLRNLSSKAVDAFRIGYFQSDGSPGESSFGSCKCDGISSLIAPGATHRMSVGIPRSGRTIDGVFVESPKPQYMVLQSVPFADGSYEGDEQVAADMAAEVFGAQVQLARIESLVDPILAEEDLDDVAKIARIRAAIPQLSAAPSPETIAQFHAQYASFPEEMLRHAESAIGSAMKAEKRSMDSLFEVNEPIFKQHRSSLTLAKFWAMMIRRGPG